MNTADAIGLPLSTPAEAGFDEGRLRLYLETLQSDIDAGLLPGALLLLVRHGRLALFEALGRLRPGEAGTAAPPMTRDAVFRIYSMTKPVVSVAALRLMEQGRLHAGDPVARYLPSHGRLTVGVDRRPATRQATVQDLLRHTAGYTYGFNDGPVARLNAVLDREARQLDNATFVERLAELPLEHEPGTAWLYSRATDVLGRVVEVVAGETLGAHLARTLFEPLGMPDTGFWVPPERHARIAEPFVAEGAGAGVLPRIWDARVAPAFESGGGGLVSTAADYARFLRMLNEGGTLDGVRVLGRKTLRWMTSDHVGELPRGHDVLPPGWGFGLGVAVRTHEGMASDPGSIGSYGWSGAAGTIFVVDPAEQLFAILMVQAPAHTERLWTRFRQMLYAAVG